MKIILTILFITLTLYSNFIPENVNKIMDLVILQKYREAEIKTSETLKGDDSLFVTFFINSSKVMDYEAINAKWSKKSLKLSDKVIKKEKKRKDIWSIYKFGVASSFRSLYKIKRGDFIGGFGDASNANNKFSKKIKEDKSLYPLYTTVALYSYYLKKQASFLSDRSVNESIAILEEVAFKDSLWYNSSAKLALYWVYFDERRYKDGDKIFNLISQDLREATTFMRSEVVSALRVKDYKRVLILSRELQEKSLNRTPKNWSDYLAGGVAEAKALNKLGDKDKSIIRAKEIFETKIPKEALKLEWVKKHRKWLINYLKQN